MTATTPGQCSFRAQIVVGNEAKTSILFASAGACDGAPSPAWRERLVELRLAIVASFDFIDYCSPGYRLLSTTVYYLQTEAVGALPWKTLKGGARTSHLGLQSWALCA